MELLKVGPLLLVLRHTEFVRTEVKGVCSGLLSQRVPEGLYYMLQWRLEQIRCNFMEKQHPEIVKWQDFFFFFFVLSLLEFWRAGQEKWKSCQDVTEPKRKLKFRQIPWETFIPPALGESLASMGSQYESCHWFPKGKAAYLVLLKTSFINMHATLCPWAQGQKLLLAWLEFTFSDVKD